MFNFMAIYGEVELATISLPFVKYERRFPSPLKHAHRRKTEHRKFSNRSHHHINNPARGARDEEHKGRAPCSLSLVRIAGMGRPERGDRKCWWMKKLN